MVCRKCDFYRSIYRYRSSYKRDGQRLISLGKFMDNLAANCPGGEPDNEETVPKRPVPIRGAAA